MAGGGGVAGGKPQTEEEARGAGQFLQVATACVFMIHPSPAVTVVPMFFPLVHFAIMGWEQ